MFGVTEKRLFPYDLVKSYDGMAISVASEIRESS